MAVIYPASRFTYQRLTQRPRECHRLTAARFLLSVGTLEPRKNIARLLQRTRAMFRRRAIPCHWS